MTGVGPGVGEHVAKAYAELGANVVISARSQDRVDRIVAEINALQGGSAIAVAADAGSRADLENLVDKAREAFGPVHILLNNAAAGVVYAHDCGLWANTDEVWKTAMEVNVLATWRLAELTSADMAAHGKGVIISVQSCGGFTPIPPAVAYGVSKAALGGERFCLFDTCKAHGYYIELMEMSDAIQRALALMELAHASWDGVTDPVHGMDRLAELATQA